MPLPIILAHKLTKKLAEARKKKILPYIGPDGKSQVTVEYRDGKPIKVNAIVISTQHTAEILDKTGNKITEKAKSEIIEEIVKPIIDEHLLSKETKYYVNPTGKFVVGGPQSDTGMTGRKIVVDTYGGVVPHGGGAFSGKDPTKVDRSATYMARYIAKNIVAAELAEKCMVELGYVIGVAEPVAVSVNTFGTGKTDDNKIVELIKKHFDLSPKGIIRTLNLLQPIYCKTASYGHFGREEKEFTWEITDKAEILKKGR